MQTECGSNPQEKIDRSDETRSITSYQKLAEERKRNGNTLYTANLKNIWNSGMWERVGYVFNYLRVVPYEEWSPSRTLDRDIYERNGGLGLFKSLATGKEDILWMKGVLPMEEQASEE